MRYSRLAVFTVFADEPALKLVSIHELSLALATRITWERSRSRHYPCRAASMSAQRSCCRGEDSAARRAPCQSAGDAATSMNLLKGQEYYPPLARFWISSR